MMSDPPRLRDDPSIDAALRAALRDAASVTPPLDTTAGLARLESAIAAGAKTASVATVASGVVAALALIGAGAAVWVTLRPATPAPAPEPPAREAPPAEQVAPPAEEDAAPDAFVLMPASEEASVSPPPEVEPAPGVRTQQRARPARTAPEGEASIAAELRELAEARRTLDGDPARAIRMLETHSRRYPHSVLDEERSALIVIALAAADRTDEARRRGQRFLSRYPESPHAARVRASIASPP